MIDDAMISALLEVGLDDWISLDEVIIEAMRDEESEKTKLVTIRLLERLFRGGLAVPGDLGESGFEDWPGAPDEWLARSLVELQRFEWRPMGAGFWLRLTDLGDIEARRRGLG
jgi:hypothetical protein